MSLADTIRKTLVPIHREGYPFIAAFAIAAVVLGLLWQPLFWIGLILTAWCTYFFRDPQRVTPVDDSLVISGADGTVSAVGPAVPPAELGHVKGAIKVLSGAAAGREVPLVKVVTTIGKPGVAVAAITKRPHGFVVAHVDGSNKPTLNGEPIGPEPVTLKSGDLLELAGTQMQFVQG